MPLINIRIENFKSIKRCDISTGNINLLIGANGTGKSNVLDAIDYFYKNLTEHNLSEDIYDENNRFSNQVSITLTFDLSSFVMISRTHTDAGDFLFDTKAERIKYGSYFESIISLASSRKNNTIKVQMTQIKGIGIRWNLPYENRFIIKSLFPFFYINTRALDILEWTQIWNVLGELGKVSNANRKTIEQDIRELIQNNPEMSGKIKAIQRILDSSQLSIQSSTGKDFAINLCKVYLAGATIQQKGKNLNYYSTGTNSVKYIELLIKAIGEISKTKLKEPLILFDEPETSLHPSFIDELTDCYSEVDPKTCLIISSHSARLVKNLITNSQHIKLYNIILHEKYSQISPMKQFTQYSPDSKYRVYDDHINAYFSKGILFVEGETELELFANPYLQILFPQLKEIDVFKAMTDELVLDVMTPRKNHSRIPYLYLIDMDKVFEYDTTHKQFKLKREFPNGGINFLYRGKKDRNLPLVFMKKRISSMTSKLKVHYRMPFYSCTDHDYLSYYWAIHDYLLFQRYFVCRTTIEGMLINDKTYNYALDFLRSKKKEKIFNDFLILLNQYALPFTSNDKVNILRLMFNGKTDLLKTISVAKTSLPQNDYELLEKCVIGKKTSGWVSEYIDGFIFSMLPADVERTPKAFKRFCAEHEDEKKKILDAFVYNFNELYELFSKIYDIIETGVKQ